MRFCIFANYMHFQYFDLKPQSTQEDVQSLHTWQLVSTSLQMNANDNSCLTERLVACKMMTPKERTGHDEKIQETSRNTKRLHVSKWTDVLLQKSLLQIFWADMVVELEPGAWTSSADHLSLHRCSVGTWMNLEHVRLDASSNRCREEDEEESASGGALRRTEIATTQLGRQAHFKVLRVHSARAQEILLVVFGCFGSAKPP